MLYFKTVDESNYNQVINIKGSTHQRDFMQPVKEIIDDHKDYQWWYSIALYDDELLVGYALYGCCGDNRDTWLDDILIDEKYQQKGYGTKFILMLVDFLKVTFETDKVYLSVFKENVSAIRLYESIGFYFINEYDEEGELIYVHDYK